MSEKEVPPDAWRYLDHELQPQSMIINPSEHSQVQARFTAPRQSNKR